MWLLQLTGCQNKLRTYNDRVFVQTKKKIHTKHNRLREREKNMQTTKINNSK